MTIQSTTAGTNTFSANVSAAGLNDTNSANNTVTTNIDVGSFLSFNVSTFIISAQNYDPQTGLMTQIIGLTNIGTTGISSARVFVAGAQDPKVPERVGFVPVPTVEDAIAEAERIHGSDCSIAVVPNAMG